MQTELLRWTIATALVAGMDDLVHHADRFSPLQADAIALQGVSDDDSRALAEHLGMTSVWSLSFYRRTPLIKSSGVGFAVLTAHTTQPPAVRVVSSNDSTWSGDRRIAQTVTVERADHSGYAIRQCLDDPGTWPASRAPTITIRPQQVGADNTRAIELPAEAADVEVHELIALPGTNAHILATSFSMPWVVSNVPL